MDVYANTYRNGGRAGMRWQCLSGDSITHLGKWDLLFPHIATRNFGIAGERSSHLLARLDPIVATHPDKLFVLIGSNDLGFGLEADEITANVDSLIEQLRTRMPECTVYLQGVMPRARRFAESIRSLNQRYRAVADRRGVVFIDLFPSSMTAPADFAPI